MNKQPPQKTPKKQKKRKKQQFGQRAAATRQATPALSSAPMLGSDCTPSTALLSTRTEFIFFTVAMFWICVENAVNNSGMFSLLLSCAYRESRPLLALIPPCWGSPEAGRGHSQDRCPVGALLCSVHFKSQMLCGHMTLPCRGKLKGKGFSPRGWHRSVPEKRSHHLSSRNFDNILRHMV